jgi:N-acetylglucosaminyldiphosphoundecaprenol N-acetyl-beta-D-mannosaminyltransferase
MTPGVHVVGAAAPPFAETPGWAKEELREALRTRPHVLWVGLGAPKQELWMAQMAGDLDVPIMLGV